MAFLVWLVYSGLFLRILNIVILVWWLSPLLLVPFYNVLNKKVRPMLGLIALMQNLLGIALAGSERRLRVRKGWLPCPAWVNSAACNASQAAEAQRQAQAQQQARARQQQNPFGFGFQEAFRRAQQQQQPRRQAAPRGAAEQTGPVIDAEWTTIDEGDH